MNYGKRIKKVQKYLKKNHLDGFLVSQPENRRYLSGYSDDDNGITETSGILFIPARGESILMTDSRYELKAKQETSLYEVVLYPQGLLKLLEKLFNDLEIRNFAFETAYTLHSTAKKLKKMCKKYGITPVGKQNVIEKMRLIKDQEELDLLRASVHLNEQVLQEIYPHIHPKISEIELAIEIETLMRKKGASGPSFSTIVASGSNSALPHAVPTSRKLGKNSPLTIDMGLILDGYCSDMTRSFCVGKPDKKYKKIHRIVRQAQLAAMKKVAPGVTASAIDTAARDIIRDAGFGKFFGHAVGHGVGLAVHEDPSISPRSTQKLKPGMIITVEPGIYIPDWGGIRLENMLAVTENSYENLNTDTTCLDI